MENEAKVKAFGVLLATTITSIMMLLTRLDVYKDAQNNWLFMFFLLVTMGMIGFGMSFLFFRGEL